MKKTPLYECHTSLNADMIHFGSWEMPLKYSNLIEEHNETRKNVTLFDTCHMGEIKLTGYNALATLQKLIPRDASKFKDNHCYYSHLCNEDGGIIDDVIIYKIKDNDFFIVTNSETYETDYEWLKKHKLHDCSIENVSSITGKIDVQGPKSRNLVNKFLASLDKTVNYLNFYTFDKYKWNNSELIISRTGYTGELGYEIYAPANNIVQIWEELLDFGKYYNVKPAGLGARDTLRIEMGFPLMGTDINNTISPLDAGFKSLVNLRKDNFIGKDAMQKSDQKYKIAFVIDKGAIARHNHIILDKDSNKVGIVTSGTFSPTLKNAIGFGMSTKEFNTNDEIYINIRSKHVKARVCDTPFVKNTSLKN